MDWKISIVALALALSFPFSAWSDVVGTTYSTILVEDPKITLNGDLADWEKIGLEPVNIEHFWFGPTTDAADISGNFRTFVSRDHLYIGVKVSDDLVCSGTTWGRKWFQDDVVQISFNGDLDADKIPVFEIWEKDYFDLNDGEIQIVADAPGKVHLEGSGVFFYPVTDPYDQEIPYTWELLGVEAVVKRTDTGYIVEMRIPKEVLGVEQFVQGTQIGLNVRIIDDDDGGEHDNVLSWTREKETEGTIPYGIVQVEAVPAASELVDLVVGEVKVEEGSQELLVTMEPQESSEVHAISALISEGKVTEAQAKLEEWVEIRKEDTQRRRAVYLLGRFYWQSGQYQKVIQTMEKLVHLSSSEIVRCQALQVMANAYDALGEYQKAITSCEQILNIVDSGSYVAKYATVEMGLYKIKLGEYEQGLRLYEEAWKEREGSRLLAFGAAYQGQGMYKDAIAQYESDVVQTVHPRIKLVGLEKVAKMYEESWEVLERRKDSPGQSWVSILMALVSVYEKQGRHREAIAQYQKVMELYPNLEASAQYSIGYNYWLLFEVDRAIVEFEKVLDNYADVISKEYLANTQIYLEQLYAMRRNYPGEEWRVVGNALDMVNAGRYEEAATIYKDLLDHAHEGLNGRLIRTVGDMFRKRGVFKEVFSEFLQLQGIEQ